MKSKPLALTALGFLLMEAVLIAFVDRPLSDLIRNAAAQSPNYIDFFRSYTDIGKSKWWLILSGVGVGLCTFITRLSSRQDALRRRVERLGQGLLFFFTCVALSGIITDIIKPVLGRARPVMIDREGFYGFHPFSLNAAMNSMPSGHATTAFAIASVLSFFFPRGQTLWLFFAAAIAVSRVMINAHYLSDIFAGALIGFLTFLLLHHAVKLRVVENFLSTLFPHTTPPLTTTKKLRKVEKPVM